MTTQDDLQGLWRRDWIKAPSTNPTFEDHDTRVYWAQSGALYADLRIPLDRGVPDGAACLADLDAAALLRLTQAQGFAGTIEVRDSICTWTRAVNWHGETADVDAGRMWFGDLGLFEDGVHSDYQELWQNAATGLTARAVRAGDLTGVLVTSDSVFLLGLGRPNAPAIAPTIAALQAGEIPDQVEALFETEYSFGHWEGDQGIADLCTNPFRQGVTVLERWQGELLWRYGCFDGSVLDIMLADAA